MTRPLAAITKMSHILVLGYGHGLEVIGMTEGGSDRVELLLAIKGCHHGSAGYPGRTTRLPRRRLAV